MVVDFGESTGGRACRKRDRQPLCARCGRGGVDTGGNRTQWWGVLPPDSIKTILTAWIVLAAAAAGVAQDAICEAWRFPPPSLDARGRFGHAVALANNELIAAATDSLGSQRVYAFRRSASGRTWSFVGELLPATSASGVTAFGWSVATDGVSAAVGAYLEDAGQQDSGVVHLYRRTLAGWSSDGSIEPPDPAFRGFFGWSVAISGNRVVIGEPGANTRNGRAWVFVRRAPNDWVEIDQLEPATAPAGGEQFGSAVALEGTVAVVGSPAYDAGALTDRGRALVFTGSDIADSWLQVAAPEPFILGIRGRYGSSVALGGGVLVIGAPGDSQNATQAGSAHLFTGATSVWTHRSRLTAPVPAVEGEFGDSVAVSGNAVVVGAPGGGAATGDAYLFQRPSPAGFFVFSKSLEPSVTNAGAEFGISVALAGDAAIVGSRGFQGFVSNGGGVYAYDLDATALEAWQTRNFGAAVELPSQEPVLWGLDADPDGDRIVNKAEAYHGTDPNAADQPPVRLAGDDGTALYLEWRRDAKDYGIVAQLYASDDLAGWGIAQGATLQEDPLSEGGFSIFARVPYGEATRFFARLGLR